MKTQVNQKKVLNGMDMITCTWLNHSNTPIIIIIIHLYFCEKMLYINLNIIFVDYKYY